MKAFVNDFGTVYLIAFDHEHKTYRSLHVNGPGDATVTFDEHDSLEEIESRYKIVDVEVTVTVKE